mmetsp:Transcript_11710/g.31568  ORF Transcript_11710/g.31568 Transcript_11710/m.31568 type:complete len:212 (-) Transcript_11710:682-1317(-)
MNAMRTLSGGFFNRSRSLSAFSTSEQAPQREIAASATSAEMSTSRPMISSKIFIADGTSSMSALSKRLYMRLEIAIPCSRASSSTDFVNAASRCQAHSFNMTLNTSSERGAPRSSGRSSLSRCSLQASSTICATMCRGAIDDVVAISSPHAAFNAWKRTRASSKSLVRNADLMITVVARTVNGTSSATILATSSLTSWNCRIVKRMLRKIS